MSRTASRYASLSRTELATLVPELLLCGHLIDRSGMAGALGEFGREAMVQIAVEEWSAASPVYTKRMQQALRFAGTDVTTIFKGMQLDIGAPPQFMDFRYRVHDAQHGEFWLDHCGALLDVEPMGAEFVVGMCHHIEDPTFDATAAATNPKARMRPIHRPPRSPADRHPHCHWRVDIDDANPSQPAPPAELAGTRAATLELAAIDASEPGQPDYSGPLLADLDLAAFSRSALVRIADEVVLQHHLLNLGFGAAVRRHLGPDGVERSRTICTRQLTGIAGLTAERIHRAAKLEVTLDGAVRMLELHPVFNPAAYVDARFAGHTVTVRRSPAHEDGAWIERCGPASTAPLQAMVRAVDPHFDVEVEGSADEWQLTVVARPEPAPEAPEVQLTRFSGGAGFAFEPRRALPLTPAASSGWRG
jgi:hypothetical protein